MISILALAVAVNCVQAPPHKPHHKTVVPVQSCAVQPPLTPPADPDELAPIVVHVYYPLIGMCYQDTPIEQVPTAAVVPPDTLGPGAWFPTGSGFIVQTVPPALEPRVVQPRIVGAPHKAPEIDTGPGLGAVTLLFGLLAVMRGRRRV